MYHLHRKAILPAIACALLLGSGCAGAGQYLKARGNDFADIFTVKLAAGPGIHAGMSYFGIIRPCFGMSKSYRIGFEGRNFVYDEHAVLGAPIYTFLVPTVSIIRGDYDRYNNRTLGIIAIPLAFIISGDEKIHRNPEKTIPLFDSFTEFSTADYERLMRQWASYLGWGKAPPNPLSGGIRDYDFRAHACFFLGFELGFNPVELVDFLLGWFGPDIMGDDHPVPATEKKPPEKDKKQPSSPK
jgi:hypothetical protein